jgi:alpha/beta hydrolase fold
MGSDTVLTFSYGSRKACLLTQLALGILSLRKIVPLLVSQGFGVIAPEMLGYGGTAKPTDASAYSRLKVGDSMKDMLITEKLDKVIVLGHDWVRIRRCTHCRGRLKPSLGCRRCDHIRPSIP